MKPSNKSASRLKSLRSQDVFQNRSDMVVVVVVVVEPNRIGFNLCSRSAKKPLFTFGKDKDYDEFGAGHRKRQAFSLKIRRKCNEKANAKANDKARAGTLQCLRFSCRPTCYYFTVDFSNKFFFITVTLYAWPSGLRRCKS